jgi:hypothetical protein
VTRPSYAVTRPQCRRRGDGRNRHRRARTLLARLAVFAAG